MHGQRHTEAYIAGTGDPVVGICIASDRCYSLKYFDNTSAAVVFYIFSKYLEALWDLERGKAS